MYLRKSDTATHISWYAWIWWPHGHTSLNSCTSQHSMEQVHWPNAHKSDYFAYIQNTAYHECLQLSVMPFRCLIPGQIIKTNIIMFLAVHKPRIKWNYIDKLFLFSVFCCILVIHKWNKTQYSIALFIFEGNVSLCVVLKTASLQRKTSFAHIVNCALCNVRLKSQNTVTQALQRRMQKKKIVVPQTSHVFYIILSLLVLFRLYILMSW